MSYKDLLVVLDPEAAARERIAFAATLAERFSAHLVGLYPLPTPEAPRHFGYYDPTLLDPFFLELRERARSAAVKMREILRRLVNIAAIPVEIREDPALVRAGDVPRAVGDPSKLKRTTGWAPKIALADSLREVYEEAYGRESCRI